MARFPDDHYIEDGAVVMKKSLMSALVALFWMAGMGGMAGEAVASTDPLPGAVEIADLARTKDWVLAVDGVELDTAAIYYSDYEVAWLVSEPDLGTLLISPRGNSVQAVSAKSFKSAGSEPVAVLKAGSVLRHIGTFKTAQGVMAFELDGLKVELKPAPPLLGRRAFSALEARHPSFELKSAAYGQHFSTQAVPFKSLPEDLVVRVYFGSWSPICERIVPKIIAVEKAWPGVRFEYYGVPKVIPDDEQARRDRITGVPTVLVVSGDTEIERLAGRLLDDPAESIGQALSSF